MKKRWKKIRIKYISYLLIYAIISTSLIGCRKNVNDEQNSFETESINDEMVQKVEAEKKEAEEAARKAEEDEKVAEEADKKAEEEKKAAEEADQKAEEEKKVEEMKIAAEEAIQKAEEAAKKAEEEKKTAEDKKAADVVVGAIKDIGVVEYSKLCKDRIDDARSIYDKLSDNQKKYVTNYSDLLNAEKLYANLESKYEEEEQIRKEKNSYSMLAYLGYVSEKIITSSENKLVLEDIYDSLLENINPETVDNITLQQVQSLLSTIKGCLTISKKRDRLQFIYNQEKASALNSALPDPLSILSLTKSKNWKDLAANVAYTVVSSVSKYDSASDSAELSFIMNGWELGDAQEDTIRSQRENTFFYTVKMVSEYGLEGMSTLNEKAIQRFVEICSKENVSDRKKLLKDDETTYRMFGKYWLELAECYFEEEDWKACLDCIDMYYNLDTGIFIKDLELADVLPKAIAAAQIYYADDTSMRVTVVQKFVKDLVDNIPNGGDWSKRYFAAQVYMSLYADSGDEKDARSAYELAYKNVVQLKGEQENLNETYLCDVKEIEVKEPDYRYLSEAEKDKKEKEFKDEKKKAKEMYKELLKSRETELPTISESLLMNMELMQGLVKAGKVSLSEKEKNDAERSIKGIFLTKSLNDKYSFFEATNEYNIQVHKDEIIIPADLLTSGAKVKVRIIEGSGKYSVNDLVLDEVEREGTGISTFYAHYSSKTMKKHEWNASSKVEVIISYSDAYNKQIELNYRVSKYDEGGLFGFGAELEFSKQ